jgi:SAM-dependent methyltransferase
MHADLINRLRCPVSRQPLTLEVLHRDADGRVCNALLFSPVGFVFPVIEGVPRLLVEAMDDHSDFLEKNCPGFWEKKKKVEAQYGPLLQYCRWKNNPTKASFGFEWGQLDYDHDRVWRQNAEELLGLFFAETQTEPSDLDGQTILDAGCGHGILSAQLARCGAQTVVGMDLSPSVVAAAARFKADNLHYLQADVMFPPFEIETFGLVHSSGVIHHTHNTELAFSILHELVAPKGRLAVWLYRPVPTFFHRFFHWVRPFTCRLPLGLQRAVYRYVLVPPLWMVTRLRGKTLTAQDLLLDLTDGLSPRYRDEPEPPLAISWYHKRGYVRVAISSANEWGYSVVGDRN